MTSPRFQVKDETGRLSAEERRTMEIALSVAAQKAGVELIVLVVEAVPGRAFRQHAVAQRRSLSRDPANSILLVLALGDRHVEIATSAKHNSVFTRSVTNRLLTHHAVPLLHQGRWADGIVAGVNAVADLLKGTKSPAIHGVSRKVKAKTVFSVIAVIGLMIAGFSGWNYYMNHTCRGCGAWGDYETHLIRSATSTQEGLEEHSFHCPQCQTNYMWTTTISYSTDSGSYNSGGDVGGGGGGDGGGGADF